MPSAAPVEPRRPGTEYAEEPCRVALNRVRGMPFDWSLNPYMGCAHRCTFCYVRGFEQRADRPSDARYGRRVRVKVNVVEVLEAELSRRGWRREAVAIGAATDPYQPAEGTYRLTRGCIGSLLRHRTPFSVITRGPLVVRDAELLAEASRTLDASVSVSIPTLDPAVVETTEPGTAPPKQRLRAVRILSEAGVRVCVAVAPILPGLSDGEEQLGAVIRAAREHGASQLWHRTLRLMPGTREHFLECLARDWPELLPDYARWYGGRTGLQAARRDEIDARVAALRREHPLPARRRPSPPRQPVQLRLL